MALTKKLLIVLVLGFVSLSSACKEESARQTDSETDPSVTELLRAIESVELAEARGLILTSASLETATVFKRILIRSKSAAGLLRINSMDLSGLTELVRSRDELRTLVILTEDVDTIGVFRSALEKAVSNLTTIQGVQAYELADPSIYHELFSQTFNLTQKLGDFSSFVEMADAKGPKLFEPGTCGDVCGNAEYAVTDVNKNQAVWIVSPRFTLPDAEGMKLILKGYSRGSVQDGKTKGFRVFASEAFDGRFTSADDQWTDVTASVSPYLPAEKGSFTSYLSLEQFRGKSMTFAIRVQGLTNASTMYQLQNFTIMGIGRAALSKFQLSAPEPLMFKEPTPEKEKEKENDEKPGELVSCLIEDGKINVKQSCRLALDAADAFDQLLVGTADKPASFKKYNFDAGRDGNPGKGYVESTKGSGWKAGTGCTPKPTNTSLQSGFCVQRTAKASRDFLVTPRITLDGNTIVKIRYAVVGPTLNKLTGETTSLRLRVLAFNKWELKQPAIELTDFAGNASLFNPAGNMFDLALQGYPAGYVSEENAALSEMIVDPATLQAKLATNGGPFQLALLQSLEGDPLLSGEPGQGKTTVWFVYSIDFIKAN